MRWSAGRWIPVLGAAAFAVGAIILGYLFLAGLLLLALILLVAWIIGFALVLRRWVTRR